MVRDRHDVPRRRGPHAWSGHGFALTVVNAPTGEQLDHKSGITKHRLTAANVVDIAQAGRGRWKIANEHTHVLKPTGDHLEHNVGHGKPSLSAFLLSLNLLALLWPYGGGVER